MSTHIIQK